ncbi:EpsG family protein [Thermophilibacter sp.]
MIPYLVMLVASTVPAILIEHTSDKRLQLVLCALAMLPFCLIAGLRDVSVGTDTSGYPLDYYQALSREPLTRVYANLSQTSAAVEPLFVIVVWIATRLFGSFGAVLFVLQLLVLLPLVSTLYREVDRSSIWIGILLYGLLVYGYSLNYARQMIAAAILVPVFFAASKGNYRLSLILCLLAAGFHITGLIGVLIVIVVFLSAAYCQDESRLVRFGVALSLVGVGACVLFGLVGKPLLNALVQLKPSYVDQIIGFGSGDPSLSALGLALVISIASIVILVLRKRASERRAGLAEREDVLLVVLVGLSGIFSQLSMFSVQLARVGTMLLTYVVILVPRIISTPFSSPARRRLYVGLALLAAFVYAVYLFVLNGVGEVVPYSFG